ncbi:MAG: RIP metalloprotease RseP, partial [Desulfobacterales bacterium]|nr:RIP metalloprotease RseP [Desulfobacterales bacterium]
GPFPFRQTFRRGCGAVSLGFGPKIFGKKIGITDYRVSAIPLGGYVKMVGEEPDAPITPENLPLSFTHKHVLKRMAIVAAGPLFNFLLAVVLFFFLFLIYGSFVVKPSIGEVLKDSPADRAGISKGDLVTAIGGNEIQSWEQMARLITESQGKSLDLRIQRGDATLDLTVTPEMKATKNLFGEDVERYVIGIGASGETFSRDLNPVQALSESLVQTYQITKLTLLSIVKIVQGTLSSKTIGGPIMIAEMAGEHARQGFANLMFFIALLSVNLGVLNFLPIPVLDGGHLLFFLVEAVTGRPVNMRAREIAQQIGIALLILLMVYVMYNDIARLVFNW